MKVSSYSLLLSLSSLLILVPTANANLGMTLFNAFTNYVKPTEDKRSESQRVKNFGYDAAWGTDNFGYDMDMNFDFSGGYKTPLYNYN